MPSTAPVFLRVCVVAGLPLVFAGRVAVAAPETTTTPPLRIDASRPVEAAAGLTFPVGGRSPDGHSLGANSRYLLRDDRPWFPVMGEFHFSRYPAEEWERELLQMKAGGVQVVATYVFWIHHEEREGRFDWTGQRDLRRFVSLCGRHGLSVWVRLGPWVHGECRNGGLPDWALAAGPTRQSAPAYLASVRRFYGEIAGQLAGLFWKDGGPIVGVQIENEYNRRGPQEGEGHLLDLQRLATEAGLVAPFTTLTAWDDTVLPARGFLPVFGGYADGFWHRELGERPPSSNFFMTPIRCEENVGDDLVSRRPDIDRRHAAYPFLTAEMGGGMATAYHRRPVISAADTAAMAVSKIGSGVTLYGYYMFHGGTNPEGVLSTLEESQATGYWNDVTVKSYDFQAPLGEFGQLAPSFRELKLLHLFLADFGETLAPMAPYFATPAPQSKTDVTAVRLALRSDGTRGFLCVNNHDRTLPLPDRPALQVRLNLAGGSLEVPARPIRVPAGAYAIWPVNQDVAGARLEYATVQPLVRLEDPSTYVFFALPGVRPELSFAAEPGLEVDAPGARVTRSGERVRVDRLTPGTQVAVHVRSQRGRADVLVLTHDQALDLWKGRIGDRERLVLSPAAVSFEDDRAHVRARDVRRLRLGLYPPVESDAAGFERVGRDGIFEQHEARVAAPPEASLQITKLQDAAPAPAVRIGARGVATPPGDAALVGAARWSLRVPAGGAGGRLFLRIAYRGDLARLHAGQRLVSDDFYKGTAWEVGLWRLTPEELARGLELRIMPLRRDAPIYLPSGARPEPAGPGDVLALEGVSLEREHEAIFAAVTRRAARSLDRPPSPSAPEPRTRPAR